MLGSCRPEQTIGCHRAKNPSIERRDTGWTATSERAVRDYVRAYASLHGRRKAAEDLGVSRHTLWRFLERGHMQGAPCPPPS